MDIRPIRTDDDDRDALAEIERLWQFPDNSRQNDKLDVLATLVEAYEADRWPRRSFSPVEILHYAVADMGHSQVELAALLGSRDGLRTLARQAPDLAGGGAEDQRRLEDPDSAPGRALCCRGVILGCVFG